VDPNFQLRLLSTTTSLPPRTQSVQRFQYTPPHLTQESGSATLSIEDLFYSLYVDGLCIGQMVRQTAYIYQGCYVIRGPHRNGDRVGTGEVFHTHTAARTILLLPHLNSPLHSSWRDLFVCIEPLMLAWPLVVVSSHHQSSTSPT
jgi:hypothetical protein